MQIKNILLTSDDGYDSLGVKLVIRALKDKYNLKIAATKTQQSGVGGMIHIADGGQWGMDQVEGVEALWVDKAPVDAVHAALSLWGKDHFDLIISGINMGPNVGGAGLISSGTYSAVVRGIGIRLAPRGIAMSWESPSDLWLGHNNKAKTYAIDLTNWLPASVTSLVEMAIKEDFWATSLLNVNFPALATKTITFTRSLPDTGDYYDAIVEMNTSNNTFVYPGREVDLVSIPVSHDAGAIRAGHISITPCRSDMMDETIYQGLKDTVLTLD